MKSGTTSLHDYLNKHPDIYMSTPKEIHYYSAKNRMSETEYLSHFQSGKKINGTSPQSYSKVHDADFKDVVVKIKKDSPNVKIIYIVRDPFQRILSHVLENRYGDDLKKMKVNFERGHYWKTSLYHYQISKYLAYFEKAQIHILTLESLKRNKLYELNRIFDFLGVDKLEDGRIFDYVKNDSSNKKLPKFIKSQLWFRIIKQLNEGLAERIAEGVVNSRYQEFLLKPKLNTIIDHKIVDEIKQDAEKLKDEFMIDISMWDLKPDLS